MLKTYLRIHLVQAEPMTRGEYNTHRGWSPPAGEDQTERGYHVVYPDGYESWCPKFEFERQGFQIQSENAITKRDIDAFRAIGTQTATKIGKKTTLVSRTYSTGIEDYATSSCVDPANFDLDTGAMFAAQKLDDRLWMFLGWALAWALNGVCQKFSDD